jgi:hypothetical protein
MSVTINPIVVTIKPTVQRNCFDSSMCEVCRAGSRMDVRLSNGLYFCCDEGGTMPLMRK